MQIMVVPSHHIVSEASLIVVMSFLPHRVKKQGSMNRRLYRPGLEGAHTSVHIAQCKGGGKYM